MRGMTEDIDLPRGSTGEKLCRHEKLERLRRQIVSCQKCRLARTRKHAVPGEGTPNASLMLIGEAPGRTEDLQGKPFVGQAGRFLDSLLEAAEVKRDEVFIGNILKCRPTSPSGRDRRPAKEEVTVCTPYLDQQIEAIEPKFILTLGDTATRYVFKKYGLEQEGISRIHGSVFNAGPLKIVPMYHPAAALYRKDLEEVIREDFRRLGDQLKVPNPNMESLIGQAEC